MNKNYNKFKNISKTNQIKLTTENIKLRINLHNYNRVVSQSQW